MKIIKVPYGLASRYDDLIELNIKLDKYPTLKKKIINHELGHTNDNYSMKDFKNDYQSEDPYFFESLKFCFKNPESWINFFPVMYSYYFKIWTWNFGIIFQWLFFGIIFVLFWYSILEKGFINICLAYLELIVILNIISLIYTHLYVNQFFFRIKSRYKNEHNDNCSN